MNYKYISCKTVIAKVYRDLNLQEEERWQDMIEWIAEALKFIGANTQLIDRPAEICIEGHRGVLPCDIHSINYVSDKQTGAKYRIASDQRHNHYEVLKQSSTSQQPQNFSQDFTYSLNGNYINTGLRTTTLIMSYKALPADSEGFLMVPDDPSVHSALFFYILKMLIMGGLVHPVFTWEKANIEWEHYCGQSRGKLNMPNLDKMMEIGRTLSRMIPQMNLDSGYFTNQQTNDSISIDNNYGH